MGVDEPGRQYQAAGLDRRPCRLLICSHHEAAVLQPHVLDAGRPAGAIDHRSSPDQTVENDASPRRQGFPAVPSARPVRTTMTIVKHDQSDRGQRQGGAV